MGLSMKLIAPLETQDYEQQHNTNLLQKFCKHYNNKCSLKHLYDVNMLFFKEIIPI